MSKRKRQSSSSDQLHSMEDQTNPQETKPLQATDDIGTGFLHIVPVCEQSRKQFTGMKNAIRSNNLHQKYRKFTSTTDPDNTTARGPGYWRIGFCNSKEGKFEWVLGSAQPNTWHANEKIDILLKPARRVSRRKISAETEAKRYAKIYLNDNGIFMVEALCDLVLDGKDIAPHTARPLSRPTTFMLADGLVYCLKFSVKIYAEEKHYLAQRNQAFLLAGRRVPRLALSGIPLNCDGRVGEQVVYRHIIGTGAFGYVYEGFDISTGDIRAVKCIRTQSRYTLRETSAEVQALQALQHSDFIVKLYHVENSLGEESIGEEEHLPLEIRLVMEKGLSFAQAIFTKTPLAVKIGLTCDVLIAIHHIHQKGWLHRDITLMNILLFPGIGGQPPRAKLADFGKVWKQPTSHGTDICNTMYQPPEIKDDASREYGIELDIFCAGIAILLSFSETDFFDAGRRLNYRERADFDILVGNLMTNTASWSLNQHLLRMISWIPGKRPSAEEVLKEPLFQDVIRERYGAPTLKTKTGSIKPYIPDLRAER